MIQAQQKQPIFGQGMFNIDQNATPDQLDRKREMIQRMVQGFGNSRYVGQGLANLATGVLAGKQRRDMNKLESEKRGAATDTFNATMGMGTPSSPMSTPFMPNTMQSTPAPTGDAASRIEQKLLQRGMPEHVAKAFVMNFQDESGLNAGINEQKPLVPGSRGGFGLYQLTGPRRVAYEQFASQRGVSPDNEDAQLDFLMQELQGSEAKAADAIFAAPDQGQAAAAIVNKFLRPAEEHRARRVARYTGGQGYAGGSQAPQVPMADLAAIVANPWATPEQKKAAQSMIQNGQQMDRMQAQSQFTQANAANAAQLRQQDPLYQAQLAQANLNLEQDRSGAVNPNSSFGNLDSQARAAGLQPGTPEYQSFMLNGGGEPATFRALKQQALAAGFEEGSPEYAEFMATRGAGLQASAKTTGTNLANIDTGGDAAQTIARGTALGKESVTRDAELREMERNMPGLRVVIDQLDVLADKATYTAAGQARDFARKQMGLEPTEAAIARAEYIATVDNQVLPLLRQTFGAAFTAKEGDTLRNTLGDPDKSPEEKKAVLRAFIAQKERDLRARQGKDVQPAPTVAPLPDFSSMSDAELDAYIQKGQP